MVTAPPRMTGLSAPRLGEARALLGTARPRRCLTAAAGRGWAGTLRCRGTPATAGDEGGAGRTRSHDPARPWVRQCARRLLQWGQSLTVRPARGARRAPRPRPARLGRRRPRRTPRGRTTRRRAAPTRPAGPATDPGRPAGRSPSSAGHPRPARDRPRTTPTARPASGRPAWTSWNRPRSRGCRDHGEPRKLWGYLLVRGGCRAAARTARPNRGGCRRRRLHRPRADSRPHHSTGAHAPGPALWAGLALGDTP